MAISQYARALLKVLEGRRLKAYPDPATGGEPWTNGYGHTGGVKAGETIDDAQAEAWLDEDIAAAEAIVDRWVTVKLTTGMRDALILFIFNIGPGVQGQKDGFVWLKNGDHSTLLTKLNAGDYVGASAEFPKWDKAAGKQMDGLHQRRLKEQALFCSGGFQGQAADPPQAPAGWPQDATIVPEPTLPPTPTPKIAPSGFPAGEGEPQTEAPEGADPMTTVSDVVDSPITKFLLAAVNPILGIVPEIAHIFIDKQGTTVPERNVAAATKLVQVAQSALKAAGLDGSNAQAVVQSISTSPEAAKVVREAVISSYFELTQMGGGLEAARSADLQFVTALAKEPWYLVFKSPSLIMGCLLLPLVYLIVLNLIGVLGTATWSPDARAALAGAISGSIVGGLVGYYYGQTTTRNRSVAPAETTASAS
jgi:GH24 family phage-related lysozyme (muramidase)